MRLFPLRRLLSPETAPTAAERPGTRPARRRRASRPRQVERLEGRTLMSVAGWVDDYGGTTGGNHAVAVDGAGDVYTLGRFTGTAGPNGGQAPTLTSAGAHDIFVAKYAPDGTFLWARRMGGPNDDYTGGIAVDGFGNVYATGDFQGTADFGPTTLTATGYQDVFVTKLDAAGNFLWAEHMGGTGGATWTYGNIALDSGGNMYLAGDFQYTASFGGVTLTSQVGKHNGPGTPNAFVLKVAGTGQVVWAEQMGGAEFAAATGGVATDGLGGVYVSGYYDTNSYGGSLTFGQLRLSAPALTQQVFVTKLNQNGQFLWASGTSGRYAGSTPWGIAANAGNVYVTGDLGGTTTFGSQTLTSSAGNSGFVTRLDPTTGAFSWVRALGGHGHSVAEDAQGNVSVGGYFSSTASFGGQVLTSAGGNDGFVARLDSSGNFLGAWQIGGTGTDDEVGGVAVDSSGVVYAAGWYSNTVNFNTGDRTVTLTSAGAYDSFILKRDPQASSATIHSVTSSTHLAAGLRPSALSVVIPSGPSNALGGQFHAPLPPGDGHPVGPLAAVSRIQMAKSSKPFSLDGKARGFFTEPNHVGMFSGSGRLRSMGVVRVTCSETYNDHRQIAGGTADLSNNRGSLHLVILPGGRRFQIASGTGAFASASGTGSFSLGGSNTLATAIFHSNRH
ncbi:MAG: SBBP repeat-containing protein [Isosphaerales bacterium]